MSSATSTLVGTLEAKKNAPTSTVVAYVSTTVVTGLNIIATLGVSSLLSRTWPKADFLLFTTLNRYLSLLYCLVSLGLGFGIVQLYKTITPEKRAHLLWNALLIVASLSVVTTAIVLWYTQYIITFFDSDSIRTRWAIIAALLWVTGQSAYHVVLSYQRGLGNTGAANTLMFVVKTLLVLSLSALAWFSDSISVAAYYGWVGLAILVVLLGHLWRLKPTWSFSVDLQVCRKLTSISWSRSLESILKHALMPIVVTILYTTGKPELAGGIVVVSMLLRGVESLFQPLVLMVLADSLNTTNNPAAQRQRVQASWDCVLFVSVAATACLFVLAEPLLALWLGESYRDLGQAFQLISLALPAVLATVLLRGNLDAKYRISPLATTNLIRIALVLLILPLLSRWNALSLPSVALTLAGLYWAQFVVVFSLLRRHYGTRLFSMSFYRFCLQKANGSGGQL